MATLYENYNTGDDAATDIRDWLSVHKWGGQSFTPSVTHTITSVKLKLYGWNSPEGFVLVDIYATDGNGHPTGSALASGSMLSSNLTGSAAWYEITLGAGATLVASTKYAIQVRCATILYDNKWLYWSVDTSSASYSGGNFMTSTDQGVNWADNTTWDFMFEDWGDPIAFIPKVFIF